MSTPSFHGESLRHGCVTAVAISIHLISATRPGLRGNFSSSRLSLTFCSYIQNHVHMCTCNQVGNILVFIKNIFFYMCHRRSKHCFDDLWVNAVHCSQFNGVLLLLFDVTLHSCHLHFPTATGRETSQWWIRLQQKASDKSQKSQHLVILDLCDSKKYSINMKTGSSPVWSGNLLIPRRRSIITELKAKTWWSMT